MLGCISVQKNPVCLALGFGESLGGPPLTEAHFWTAKGPLPMRFIKCVVKPAILLRRRLEGMVATSSVIFLLTLSEAQLMVFCPCLANDESGCFMTIQWQESLYQLSS